MAYISFLLVTLACLVLGDYNQFVTPLTDFQVIAGQPFTLEWDNRTAGYVSIYLMPWTSGENTVWTKRISIGAEDIANSGTTTVQIPSNVTTGSTQYYFFEIENPDLLDSNSFSDTPDGKNGTNYSNHFFIKADASTTASSTSSSASATATSSTTPLSSPSPSSSSSSSLSTGAIAGIAVGGAVVAVIAAMIIWLKCTKKARIDREETADLTYTPSPHSEMAEARRAARPTPTTPPIVANPQIYSTPTRNTGTPAPSYYSSPRSPDSGGSPVGAQDMTQAQYWAGGQLPSSQAANAAFASDQQEQQSIRPGQWYPTASSPPPHSLSEMSRITQAYNNNHNPDNNYMAPVFEDPRSFNNHS